MQDIRTKRRAVERNINWRAYQEQRLYLACIFPNCIARSGERKLPLALGIKADLIGANTGLRTAEIKHFLRAYTFGPKYLRTLKKGSWRFDLEGAVDGWVSPNEAEYARLSLEAHYAIRRAGRVGLAAVESALAGESMREAA